MRAASASYSWLRDFDWVMTAQVVAISLVGLLQVYSCTVNKSQDYVQHAVWLLLGMAMYWIASRVDYHQSIALAPHLWVGGVGLLVIILVFTEPVAGAQRWLPTPFGFSVQVSEYMKLVLVLVVAKFCRQFPIGKLRVRDFVSIGILFLIPFALVLEQPDLSTALSMAPMPCIALLLSTIRTKHIVGACLLGVLLLPVAWMTLEPYQKQRITGFVDSVDPESAERQEADAGRGDTYQIDQSKIAVGSGGVWGQGFGRGSQTQLLFLPTSHTDFILAAFAEERGFVGVALVLGLYYALILRIVRTAQTAADPEGMLVAMGVAALLLFHIVVNVGMVANKLPVTGLPLPLMSYGGSNLLTTLAMLGLVNSVRINRFVN